MNANDNGHALPRIEARAWLVKLQGGAASPELLAEFETWCEELPGNLAAYELEVAAYRDMTRIKAHDEFGTHGDWRKSSETGWLKIGAVAAAIVAALFVVVAGSRPNMPVQMGERMTALAFEPFSTQRGEIRKFQLSDGSVATLDTDSKIEVSITDERRLLRLAHGRARIQVAAGRQPFLARAGAGEVVANSGSFDIAYDGEQNVTVQLLNGDAYIRPMAQFASLGGTRQTLRLDTAFAYRAGDFSTMLAEEVDQSPLNKEWPDGWVEYETIRLDRLLVRANSHAAKPIRLADASLGSLQVAGRFKISDTSGFIERICDLFDLRATEDRDAIYLRKI